MTNEVPVTDRERVGEERRADLEDGEREADRDGEGEEERPAPDLLGLGVALLRIERGVACRDRESAKADRERLAECDDAADDRQAQCPVARRERVDRAADVRDLAVGLADGDRPVPRAAHHDALEDGLAADCLGHG